MSLFSVHNATDGAIVLHLEETDANLDLIEDIVDQVPLLHITRIREFCGYQAQASLESARQADKVRQAVPPVIAKIAAMSEDEALTLAEQLIDAVKFSRAIAGKVVKLELVK
jgi:hypothetical protein